MSARRERKLETKGFRMGQTGLTPFSDPFFLYSGGRISPA